MPRSPNHRLKVLYVMNFLLHNSDEGHPVTMRQIIDHLESNGISAERKSIYDDIDALRDFGLDIVPVSYTHLDVYKRQGWYCCSKQVEIRSAWLSGSADAELMMVDSADS